MEKTLLAYAMVKMAADPSTAFSVPVSGQSDSFYDQMMYMADHNQGSKRWSAWNAARLKLKDMAAMRERLAPAEIDSTRYHKFWNPPDYPSRKTQVPLSNTAAAAFSRVYRMADAAGMENLRQHNAEGMKKLRAAGSTSGEMFKRKVIGNDNQFPRS